MRGLREWEEEGLSLSTKDEEAAQLLDRSIHCLMKWEGDAKSPCVHAIQLDPNFVMAHIILSCLYLLSMEHTKDTSHELAKSLEVLNKMKDSPQVNERFVYCLWSLFFPFPFSLFPFPFSLFPFPFSLFPFPFPFPFPFLLIFIFFMFKNYKKRGGSH